MAILSKNQRFNGMTLIEVLVVLAIFAILIILVLFAFRPQTQLGKARDARRKADLSRLKNKLDDYYNDNSRYPANLPPCGQSLSPYLSQVPCDPKGNNYTYVTDTSGQWYKIYAKLENTRDPVIANLGCQSGCGPAGDYNYGVSSPNVSVGEIIGSPRCPGWTSPSCSNPSAYCPPQGGTACCSPRYLYCSPPDFWCCP